MSANSAVSIFGVDVSAARYDFDAERVRIGQMIRTQGLQVIEDLLLSSGLAFLDQVADRTSKREIQRYHRALDQARRNLTRARVLGNL